MTTIVDWTGKSGTTYRYWSVDLSTEKLKASAGNYAFVKQLANGNFTPIYFGETDSLKDRIPSHEKWMAAVRLGATHVMAHATQAGELSRLAEEQDLIERWNPPLNVQHRTAG
jgi:hypothetical protein